MSHRTGAAKRIAISPGLVARMGMNGAFRLLPNVLWPVIMLLMLGFVETRTATAMLGLPLVLGLSLGIGASLAELRSHRRHALLPGRWRLFGASLAAALVLWCLIGLLTLAEPGGLQVVVCGGMFGLGLGLLGGWLLAPGALLLLTLPAILVVDDPVGRLDAPMIPLIAALVLIAGFLWQLRPLHSRRSRTISEPVSSSSSPLRHGRLFGPWQSLKWMLNGAVLLLVLMLAMEREVSLDRLGWSAGFLFYWALFGIMALSGQLWRERGCVRRLSLLPGWSRRRLFSHFDRSLWRAVGWLFAATVGAMVAAGALGPATGAQVIAVNAVWMATMWVIVNATLVILTVERSGHSVPMFIVMLPVILPLITMAPVHRVEPGASWIVVLLVGFGVLGACLRHLARQRWQRASLTAVFSRV